MTSPARIVAMREDMSAPRDALAWFAQRMEEALRANDHKLGWESLTPSSLIRRCEEELYELRQALADGDPVKIVKECADAANFLMMLADNIAGSSMNGEP